MESVLVPARVGNDRLMCEDRRLLGILGEEARRIVHEVISRSECIVLHAIIEIVVIRAILSVWLMRPVWR